MRPRVRQPLARAALAATLAAALLAGAACGDATAPAPPLQGQWVAEGVAFVSVTTTTIELALEQQGGTVTGEGSFVDAQGFAADLAVSGMLSGDVVQLTMTGPALTGPLVYNAFLGGGARRMQGTLTYGDASTQREFQKLR